MRSFLFALLVTAWAWSAHADPFVCFTSTNISSNTMAEMQLAGWNPSCQTLQNIGDGLKATALVFSGASIGMACTGVGAPATLWLQGSAVGLQVLNLIVGRLPCDDQTRQQAIQSAAEEAVCHQLLTMGITCQMH